jgi:hypothetical protein
MRILLHRPRSAFFVFILLLSVGLLCSCKRPAAASPRDELVSALKGANVDGFDFATNEDESQAVASLTNGAVRGLVNMDTGPMNFVLRYTRVKDKKTNTVKTYKTEMVKAGKELTLQVTDLASNEVVSKNAFQRTDGHSPSDPGAPPTFNTLEDCIKDFNCTRRGALECEANRTCKDQFAALICCLNNGQCFSVHLIIRPTSLICRLINSIPDFEGFVLTQ